MKILGIDPGLARIGIGVVERGRGDALKLLDCCTITTAASLPRSERLAEIGADLGLMLRKHRPDLAVVERLYFAKNRRTAMGVAEARGVILLTLHQSELGAGQAVPHILEPTPLELKVAITGDGGADKRQVRDMLLRILKLEADFFRGSSDDATDAVALALYGALMGTTVACARGTPPASL